MTTTPAPEDLRDIEHAQDAPQEYPEGVRVIYEVQLAAKGGTVNRLLRYIVGPIPSRFWEDAPQPAHTRAIHNGILRQMLCMHAGSMDECIARADEQLSEMYAQDELDYLLRLKQPKKKEKKAITLQRGRYHRVAGTGRTARL